MNLTPNYNLKKPEYTDNADLVVFVADNMTILDTQLKSVGDVANEASLNKKTDSYLTWATNANTGALDAGFGKLNEDTLTQIGLQLAMYGWFKGDSKITYPFTNLKLQDTFYDCVNDGDSLAEIAIENNYILALINSSPYAKSVYETVIENDLAMKDVLSALSGLNSADYVDMSAFANSLTARTALLATPSALDFSYKSNLASGKLLVAIAGLDATSYANATDVANSTTAMNAVMASTTARDYAFGSALIINIFAKASNAKTAIIANQALFNTHKTTMLSVMDANPALFTKTTLTNIIGSPTATTNVTNVQGTANSLVYLTAFVDSSTTYYFSSAKHAHNLTEVVHTAFPTGAGTGTVNIDVFAVGGASITWGYSHATVYYSGIKYEAV